MGDIPLERNDFRRGSVDVDVNFTQNSLRPAPIVAGNNIIEVKSRAQGIVLNSLFKTLSKIIVKLIATDLPDRVLYDLTGEQLRRIIQDKYAPIADDQNQLAVIPFALSGYLDLSDDAYIEVTLEGAGADLKYDRIIPIGRAANPMLVKKLTAEKEFDSAAYDEIFFIGDLVDLRFNSNGQGVYLPQVFYRNVAAIKGFASQKLVPNTTYSLSQATDFLLVEF